MSKFFDLFPKVLYDIAGKNRTNYSSVTNVFFRLRILRKVLSNISAYYEYVIQDTDTPEILAEKIYGDAEAHWIILLANDIIDAQYDWPLGDRDFLRYIAKKYDSVPLAKSTIHHYEKVVQREESFSGIITETRFVIDLNPASETDIGVPYDAYSTLAETATVETINMGDGKTVVQTSFRDAISVYDWEQAANEAKRTIKIIKPEYYPRIIAEFNKFTNDANAPYLRKLV
jgi:hypothetical protein